jgi:alpha-beta hydrolase superfamily lysophospholipase
VDFHNANRAPLLLIAGGEDRTPSQSTNESIYKYCKTEAVTELKAYQGRPHFHVGIEGWEEVADYAIDWGLRNAR